MRTFPSFSRPPLLARSHGARATRFGASRSHLFIPNGLPTVPPPFLPKVSFPYSSYGYTPGIPFDDSQLTTLHRTLNAQNNYPKEVDMRTICFPRVSTKDRFTFPFNSAFPMSTGTRGGSIRTNLPFLQFASVSISVSVAGSSRTRALGSACTFPPVASCMCPYDTRLCYIFLLLSFV